MPGADTFDRRLAELADRIGEGKVHGTLEVDQAYAQYQHEGLDLKHPRGGQAKYLEGPLYTEHQGYLSDIAARVLAEGPVQPLADSLEDLSQQVFDHAPIEFLDLRASGHPTVAQGGQNRYDRPPMQARLTDAQLKAKTKLRGIGSDPWGDVSNL